MFLKMIFLYERMTQRTARCAVFLVATIALPVHPRARVDASTPPVQATEQASTPPPAAFVRVCGKCHNADRIVEGRRTRAQWGEVIDAMVAKGAEGTDDDFAVIIEHLVSEYGRVRINTAPAAEVAQVLHLQKASADLLVDYRTTHGKFADFDALIKVPDAPVEALKARRDAILF